MVRLTSLLLRRSRYFQRFHDQYEEADKHVRHGPMKWRDYKSPFIDPPYWYKWSTQSPYSPREQSKIRQKTDIGWYKNNYQNRKYTSPDEWLFHVGDRVEVLVGEDKGKKGEVVQIIPDANWVIIGGMNCKFETHDGELYGIEEPLEHHEVSLVDPKTDEATEVEFRANEDGVLVRVSLKTGHVIVKPPELLHDRTVKTDYIDQSKDTPDTVALKRTYIPSMKHHEDELKEIFKINDPPRRETFWY